VNFMGFENLSVTGVAVLKQACEEADGRSHKEALPEHLIYFFLRHNVDALEDESKLDYLAFAKEIDRKIRGVASDGRSPELSREFNDIMTVAAKIADERSHPTIYGTDIIVAILGSETGEIGGLLPSVPLRKSVDESSDEGFA
jgi:ATP-dependent Clp protease ATP-binding subunit ClpA